MVITGWPVDILKSHLSHMSVIFSYCYLSQYVSDIIILCVIVIHHNCWCDDYTRIKVVERWVNITFSSLVKYDISYCDNSILIYHRCYTQLSSPKDWTGL